MQFWVGLVAGLIIGWIIEWIIDWYFWRQESLQSLLDEVDHSRVGADDSVRQELNAARQEIAELRRRLGDSINAPAASAPTASAPAAAPTVTDALSRINGIGKVYEQRLNEAGIFTFVELAQTSPERLREIMQPADWQAVDFASWVEQANALARESLTSAKGA